MAKSIQDRIEECFARRLKFQEKSKRKESKAANLLEVRRRKGMVLPSLDLVIVTSETVVAIMAE